MLNSFLSEELIQGSNKELFKNIVIVNGPFQLLNAVETINEFQLKNVLLIVLINKLVKVNKQMDNYIDKYSNLFFCVEKLKFSNGSMKYIEYMKFIYLLKKNSLYFIAFATLGRIEKLLLTKLEYNKAILFDDGLETIHTAELLSISPKLVRPQYFYLGFNRSFKKQFICFSILQHGNKALAYRKNNMNFIDTQKQYSVDTQVVAFIGQDFVRTQYVHKKDYFEVLDFISNKYAEYKIEYYPHRGEDDISLKEISEIYDNIIVMKIDTTFEMYLSSKKVIPKKVISCWSTVLIVIKNMFKDIEVESILINQDKLIKNQNKINETYAYFAKENIIVLDINKMEIHNV